MAAAEAANQVIINPPAGVRNMSEWAKQPACWTSFSKVAVSYEKEFVSILIDPEEARSHKREQRLERKEVSAIEAQTEVLNQGGAYWAQLLAFGRSIGKLSPADAVILEICSHIPRKLPSDKQAIAAVRIADQLEKFY
jgi:hypothetical protein